MAALGGVSGSALVLQPSNADGKGILFSVGTQCELKKFVDAFYSKPLGTITIHEDTRMKGLKWDYQGNWQHISTYDPKYATFNLQNSEAKKLMELFVHLATEQEIEQMRAVLPLEPMALGVVLDAKRNATDNVIIRLMNFLDEHEQLLPKTSTRKPTAKASTTGALIKRWYKLKYTTLDPGVPVVNPIHTWSEMNANGTATNSGSSSSIHNSNKRSRIGDT